MTLLRLLILCGLAPVTLTADTGEGGGDVVLDLRADLAVHERCGCRTLRLRVSDDGRSLLVE